MQSITRYPGGKSKRHIQEIILSYAPETYSSYREPFAGGAGIFFGVPCNKDRWINDKNAHLIKLYVALRDRPREFIEMCRQITPFQPGEPEVESTGGTLYPKRLYELFYELRDNPDADSALRFFYCNRMGHTGRVVLDGELYKGFFIHEATWTYCGTSLKKKKQGRELIITNYPVAVTGATVNEIPVDICAEENCIQAITSQMPCQGIPLAEPESMRLHAISQEHCHAK